MWLAKIYVTLKPVVNDPQGLAIKSGLNDLGYRGVRSVRAGKYLEVVVDAESQQAAAASIHEMCSRLLANTVIEDYRFDLELRPDQ